LWRNKKVHVLLGEKFERRARTWKPAQYWGNEIVKEALAVLAPVALTLCPQFCGHGSIERVHQVQSLRPPDPVHGAVGAQNSGMYMLASRI